MENEISLTEGKAEDLVSVFATLVVEPMINGQSFGNIFGS